MTYTTFIENAEFRQVRNSISYIDDDFINEEDPMRCNNTTKKSNNNFKKNRLKRDSVGCISYTEDENVELGLLLDSSMLKSFIESSKKDNTSPQAKTSSIRSSNGETIAKDCNENPIKEINENVNGFSCIFSAILIISLFSFLAVIWKNHVSNGTQDIVVASSYPNENRPPLEQIEEISLTMEEKVFLVSQTCTKERVSSLDGFDACFDLCKERICCFLDAKDDDYCYDYKKDWCDEFVFCNVLDSQNSNRHT